MVKKEFKNPASFKDPSGYVFMQDHKVFRRVRPTYFSEYEYLINSGLYRQLTAEKLLIPHKLIKKNKEELIIEPVQIPFISYPYEWSFSQFKDAAIQTLKIQKLALDCGMSLKDASSYNIQFFEGGPILIDTLSFERYQQGQGWKAYRQFCMHFLSPLILMSLVDIRLNKLMQVYLDGIPLDLTNSLLHYKSWFNLGALIHIKAHAKAEFKFSDIDLSKSTKPMKLSSLYGLIDHLEGMIKKLKLRTQLSEWADYYKDTNYSAKAFVHKKHIIKSLINQIKPKQIWDLGANDGTFSRLVSERNSVISLDIDPLAVDYNYRFNKSHHIQNCLPLVFDLTNPSPGLGWANMERLSLIRRGPTDLIMVLALVHHLVISNNLNFEMIADFFSKITRYLIIEFVPKEDSQVQKLLRNRQDIFTHYNLTNFEKDFKRKFTILSSQLIKDSTRRIYLMKTTRFF